MLFSQSNVVNCSLRTLRRSHTFTAMLTWLFEFLYSLHSAERKYRHHWKRDLKYLNYGIILFIIWLRVLLCTWSLYYKTNSWLRYDLTVNLFIERINPGVSMAICAQAFFSFLFVANILTWMVNKSGNFDRVMELSMQNTDDFFESNNLKHPLAFQMARVGIFELIKRAPLVIRNLLTKIDPNRKWIQKIGLNWRNIQFRTKLDQFSFIDKKGRIRMLVLIVFFEMILTFIFLAAMCK